MSLLSSNLQKAMEYEAEMACPGREINNEPFAKNTPSFKVTGTRVHEMLAHTLKRMTAVLRILITRQNIGRKL
jgi:hypothetical protein